MNQSKRDLLIIGPTRSGTSALRMALNAHPQAIVFGELIPVTPLNRLQGLKTQNARQLPDLEEAFNLRFRDPTAFLDTYCFSADADVVGFKMVYPQVLSPEFAATMQDLLARPNLHIITTWRRDLTARFRSQILKWQEARGDYVARIERYLSIGYIVQDCRNQLAMRQTVERMLGNQPRARVDHEDFAADPHRELARLFEFLGLPEQPVEVPARPTSSRSPLTDRLDAMLADSALDCFRNCP